MDNKIPLRIQQAIDLILAIPAHRSSNENHAKFGNLIIEEYFVKLREEYKDDNTAYNYLNNLFAAISSSVRAFSVQRDIFQTKWNSLNQVKNSYINRANRLDIYSPFNGNIGKVISLFVSLGSSSIIVDSYNDFLETIGRFAFWIPILFIIIMFIFDFILGIYKNYLISKAEKVLPNEVIGTWREENITQYRKIVRSFLFNAIEIHKYFYSKEKIFDEDISDMDDEQLSHFLDKIVDKHMIF